MRSELATEIRQIGELAPRFEGALATFTRGRLQGFLFRPADGDDVLILPKGGQIPDGYAQVLHATVDAQANRLDLSDGTWLRHPLIRGAGSRPRSLRTLAMGSRAT